MTKIRALAATLAVAALACAAPAQAADDVDRAAHCDVKLERLIEQFYDMADRRSYEAASEWWDARWHAYFQSCVI